MSQNLFVVIEHFRGQVADISYVMLAAARQLSQAAGGEVVAVLLGHKAQGLADTLAADRVLYMDDAALAEFTSDAYQVALAALDQRTISTRGSFWSFFLGYGCGQRIVSETGSAGNQLVPLVHHGWQLCVSDLRWEDHGRGRNPGSDRIDHDGSWRIQV